MPPCPHAEKVGARRYSGGHPYYNKATQRGLIAHFKQPFTTLQAAIHHLQHSPSARLSDMTREETIGHTCQLSGSWRQDATAIGAWCVTRRLTCRAGFHPAVRREEAPRASTRTGRVGCISPRWGGGETSHQSFCAVQGGPLCAGDSHCVAVRMDKRCRLHKAIFTAGGRGWWGEIRPCRVWALWPDECACPQPDGLSERDTIIGRGRFAPSWPAETRLARKARVRVAYPYPESPITSFPSIADSNGRADLRFSADLHAHP